MQQVMGIGHSYQEHLQRWLQLPEYGVELLAGSLMTHLQVQHGVVRGYQG